jgi:hypothetical protein
MYIRSLSIYNLRCFGKTELELQYPGRDDELASDVLPNVNVLLGGNGSGKTSVLRALAMAPLGPVLAEASGFVPYYLVRRLQAASTRAGRDKAARSKAPAEKPPETLIKARAIFDKLDRAGVKSDKPYDLLARLRTTTRGSIDLFVRESVPSVPIDDLLDDRSPSMFVVGYGATRRAARDLSEFVSFQRVKVGRYQRVASLFEDQTPLRPLESWLPRLQASRAAEVRKILDDVLPAEVRFTGEMLRGEDQFMFLRGGIPVPFTALSDGYRAFVSWFGDLLGHLCDCTPTRTRLASMTGLVLVDEVDLHLHPNWQRRVVQTVARTFPRLQFVFTTHSPLVAGALSWKNIHVSEALPDGGAKVSQFREDVRGRDAAEVLESSYFGMDSTRDPGTEDDLRKIARRVDQGDAKAAIEYLKRLGGEDEAGDGAVKVPAGGPGPAAPKALQKIGLLKDGLLKIGVVRKAAAKRAATKAPAKKRGRAR